MKESVEGNKSRNSQKLKMKAQISPLCTNKTIYATTLAECLILIPHQAVSRSWTLVHGSCCSLGSRSSLESWVADDLADLALVLEGPLAFISVGEGDIGVLAPGGDNRLVLIVKNLTSHFLLLDKLANHNLNGLERSSASHRWLVLSPSNADVREYSL